MFENLSISQFLTKIIENKPTPGGGSVCALSAALAAALTGMVANLTIGKKKYEDKEVIMLDIVRRADQFKDCFTSDIDTDSDAYNKIFDAYKLPKETDEGKTKRSKQIQDAIKIATEVPMEVARNTIQMMDMIEIVIKNGNQNAITDACVAIMTARTAALGALLSVRMNLQSIQDKSFVERYTKEVNDLEELAINKEFKLVMWVKAQFSNQQSGYCE